MDREQSVIILLRCLGVNCVSDFKFVVSVTVTTCIPRSKNILLSTLAQTVTAICYQASHCSEPDLLQRTFHKHSYDTVLST